MAMIDLDVDLSDEERRVRDTVHKFAAEVMRPAGVALDRLADPAEVIAPQSPLWEAFKKYRALGLEAYTDPSSDLPPLQRARLRYIIAEELGWGDSGLAISFGVAGFPRMLAQLSGKPELIERFGDPNSVGCWGGTEPHHGSDLIIFSDKLGTPAYGKPDCVARKEGDFFVINGQKSAWVSNGTIASASALFCAVDLGAGVIGNAGFVVPLDVPGVSRGKPLNKIGQRALNQGEIFFDNLRIPTDYMVLGPEMFAFATDSVLSLANSGMGVTFVGVAQAALDLALDYAKQRVQGGVPIIQHQSVKARLFEMFRKVEAARSLARRVMVYNATNTPPALQYAVASKVTATSTAFEVASAALQIFGGNGLSREYPIEKLLRDARASMIEDGCNEVLGLVAAERL
ncbi:MAG: acyl-CoA/acyl-ACP dehydrogenase [Deltaproteobacteria bacterium]|nr:acyl-CoA/acyl-ACP dehydrogenase [Deltaproteobacteria bacterium]